MIAFLLWSSYPNRDFVAQLGMAVPADLEAMIAKRDYELMFEAGPLVPEEFVDAFAWAGTPEEVAAKITRIAEWASAASAPGCSHRRKAASNPSYSSLPRK